MVDSVLADQAPVDDDDPDDPKELLVLARPLDTERRKQDSYKILSEKKVKKFICASEESFWLEFLK